MIPPEHTYPAGTVYNSWPSRPDSPEEVIAHRVISDLCELVGEVREDYPDIGEDDWETIVYRVMYLTKPPSATEYHLAYDFLAARADHDV